MFVTLAVIQSAVLFSIVNMTYKSSALVLCQAHRYMYMYLHSILKQVVAAWAACTPPATRQIRCTLSSHDRKLCIMTSNPFLQAVALMEY